MTHVVRGRLSGIRTALLAAVVGYAAPASAGQVCTTGPFVQGVDVSAGQGSIDWKAAATDGVVFAYMKASQGTYLTDSTFADNWSGTKAAGVIRGAYHFLDPDQSGVDQANYFLGVMGSLSSGDLPPMLDVECPDGDDNCLGVGFPGIATGAALTQVMTDWLRTVEAATGQVPVIYTFPDYFSSNSVDTTGITKYPLFIATIDPSCMDVPDPWASAAFWQYSWTGTVSGIGSVDLDYFLGTTAQLAAFAGHSGFAPPSAVNGNDALSAVSWADGHVELYAMKTGGTAARIDTSASEPADGGSVDTWAAPVALDGKASCGVASVYWAPGSGHTSEVFDGLPDGTTESLEYVGSSSSWTAFSSFGGTGLTHLSTLAYPDSHVEVFALGADGAIWHNASTQASWSGWKSMGSIAAAFATGAGPILWRDGHAELFATDAHGGAWHNVTGTASPPIWGGWTAIGGGPLASRPMPARWADGHVQVFARGVDNHLYSTAYASGDGGSDAGGALPDFTVINPSQVITGEPSVLVYAAYGPEVFARDPAGDVVHMWRSSGSWSAWADDFGQVIVSDPLAWMRPDGLAEVFGVDANGNVVKSLHDGASWSAWSTIGAGFDPCVGGTRLVDAGVPVPPVDAGHPVDAGLRADARPEQPDSGVPTRPVDAGHPVDTGRSPRDAARVDGNRGAVDAPTDSDAAEWSSASSSSGCSCRAAPGARSGVDGRSATGLLALALTARRRRKRGARAAG